MCLATHMPIPVPLYEPRDESMSVMWLVTGVTIVLSLLCFCVPQQKKTNPVPVIVPKEPLVEPKTPRETYLDQCLEMATHHRKLLEEEIKMLEVWVDFFQENPAPSSNPHDEIDTAIFEVLQKHRMDGLSVKNIFGILKDFFEDLTTAEICERLYYLQARNQVNVLNVDMNESIWRL